MANHYEDLDTFASSLTSQLDEATGRRDRALSSLYEMGPPRLNRGEMMATALLSIFPAVAGALDKGTAGLALGAEAGAKGAAPFLAGIEERRKEDLGRAKHAADLATKDVDRLSGQLATTRRQGALQKGRDSAMLERDTLREQMIRGRPKAGNKPNYDASLFGGDPFASTSSIPTIPDLINSREPSAPIFPEEEAPSSLSERETQPRPRPAPRAEAQPLKPASVEVEETEETGVESTIKTKYDNYKSADEVAQEIFNNPRNKTNPNPIDVEKYKVAQAVKSNVPALKLKAEALEGALDPTFKKVLATESVKLNSKVNAYKGIAYNLSVADMAFQRMEAAKNSGNEAVANQQKNILLQSMRQLNAIQKELRNTGASSTPIEISKFFTYTPGGLPEGKTDVYEYWDEMINKGALKLDFSEQVKNGKRSVSDEFRVSIENSPFLPPYTRHYEDDVGGFVTRSPAARTFEMLLSGTGLKPQGKVDPSNPRWVEYKNIIGALNEPTF